MVYPLRQKITLVRVKIVDETQLFDCEHLRYIGKNVQSETGALIAQKATLVRNDQDPRYWFICDQAVYNYHGCSTCKDIVAWKGPFFKITAQLIPCIIFQNLVNSCFHQAMNSENLLSSMVDFQIPRINYTTLMSSCRSSIHQVFGSRRLHTMGKLFDTFVWYLLKDTL